VIRNREAKELEAPKRKVSAATIAAALGLRDGGEPKPDEKLSPNQVRQRERGEKVTPTPEEARAEIHTLNPGREIADLWGLTGENMPLNAEADMAPPKPRPSAGWEGGVAERQPFTSGKDADAARATAAELAREVEQVRQDARASLQRTIRQVETAAESGDPEEKRRAAAEAERARSWGEKLKARLGVERI
jgi:hypothetical protein